MPASPNGCLAGGEVVLGRFAEPEGWRSALVVGGPLEPSAVTGCQMADCAALDPQRIGPQSGRVVD